MMGTCEKALQAAYERNHHPPEKLHQPRFDDCITLMAHALSAVDAMIMPGSSAFVAERPARNPGVDTAARMPRLRELTMRLAERRAFRSTEP